MFCTHCGTKHRPAANFCIGCGAAVPVAAASAAPEPTPVNTAPATPAPAVVATTTHPGPATLDSTPAAVDSARVVPAADALEGTVPADAADLAAVAEAQSVTALEAADASAPILEPLPEAREATLPGLTIIEPLSVAPPPPSPAADRASQAQVPRSATFPAGGPGVGSASQPASPVTPYSAPATHLPPIPEVHPSVAAAPRPESMVPSPGDLAARLRAPKGEVDERQLKKIGIVIGAAIYTLVMVTLIVRFFSEPSYGRFFAIVAMGMVTTAAVVGVIAYLAHAKETREARTLASLPPSVQHVVAQMDGGAQAAFFNEYERRKKRIVVSYLLMWFFWAHYFYLRQAALNFAFWAALAFFGFGWLWYWFDVFRMPSLVRAANEQTAREALQTLHIGAAFAQMPAAPSLMTQPVPPATPINPAPGPGLQDR